MSHVTRHTSLLVLSVVLFLSGISALIFETLWLRLSGLAFGNSTWAAALILSSFMAGLALGTAVAASVKLRMRPLKLYATLETAVAVFGCTIVFALPILGELLRPLFQALWSHQPLLLALRVLISFVILLIPTTAMGLTLPVVLEDPILREQRFGRSVGLLYGFNTIGAVAGALMGELLLIKVFGLWGTSLCAGLLNIIAATVALFLIKGETLAASPTKEGPRRLSFEFNYRPPWKLLIVSFGAGLLLLCLEVVWFRFLRLYIASSASAFSLMLAVVLAGIGIGGAISGAISRISRNGLSILFLIAGIATLLCYEFFPVPKLKPGEANFYFEAWQTITFLAVALMFPVSLISGVMFPTIASAVQETVENRLNCLGVVTLFNTAGAAIGPLLTGFVLLPKFGFQTSLVFCALGYLILALLSAGRTFWTSGWSRLVLIVLLGAFLVIIVFFPFHRDQIHFANARKLYEDEGQHLVTKIEGTSDTWQLLRRDLFGLPYYYRLVTNGFSMSATNPVNQRYMRSFAYLAMALHPNAHEALLIAYGCGVTADALTHDFDLRRIDVVDISKEVYRLSSDYRDAGYSNPLTDSRVNAIIQDGRFFLQASPKQYDIITGEPPPPKVAGAVNLYTEQFFKLMSDRLNDGGIATFWLPIYQLTVDETKAILRGFHEAFPNTIIWSGPDEEWIMLGIKGAPRAIGVDELRRLFRDSNTKSDLGRIGIETQEELQTMFLMDGDQIDQLVRDAKPLTDLFPRRLGDDTSVDPAIHEFALNYVHSSSAAARFRSSNLIQQLWPNASSAQLDPFFVIREMRYRGRLENRNWLADLDVHLRGSNLREPVLETLRTNSFRVALAEKVANNSNPPPPDTLPDLVAASLADRNYSKAIQLLDTKQSAGAANRDDLLLLTYLNCLNHDVAKAESVASGVADRDEPLAKWLFEKLQAEYGFRPPS
ncbi:MAG TPA: fused MFS/spermidine synthase [Chthoniobacterales bacterium]|nr:fused MFS/spermidine synthase [Chthoniobacterales bacterium]